MSVPGGTLFWCHLFKATQSGWVALDKQEVFMEVAGSSSFCFTFGKKGGLVLGKVVVLSHPCDRSLLLLVFPPLACLP